LRLARALRVAAEGLPAAALSDILRQALGGGSAYRGAWPVLLGWAVLAPVAAALTFRWE